jgi:hypothetical protein
VASTSGPQDLLLPPGACLLHIGPPKTGTSALQGAFHAVRPSLHEQGVHYAGRGRHSGRAIHAVTGRAGFFTDGEVVDIGEWTRLVKDSQRPGDERVVVSSEFFADAVPEHITRIVDDLGRSRVHVVITLRPLIKIAPSQWQQYIVSGQRRSFTSWTEAIFGDGEANVTPTFWRRHRHDKLVQRWIDDVGLENVTVVAVDDRDHDMLMRTFEAFTGLREGTLVMERDVTNRSLGMYEVEAVRSLNSRMFEEGMPSSAQSRLVHFGAARYLRQFDLSPDEPRVELPRWAAERAAEISLEMTAAIAATGVRIVGDLDRLNIPVGDAPESIPKIRTVPRELSARLAMGVIVATGEARRTTKAKAGAAKPPAETPDVARTSSVELARVIALRGRAASTRKLKQWRRKVTRRSGQSQQS